jgi:hypothetical protein
MNSSGLILAWGPATGAQPMAKNRMRIPCQPAPWCTSGVWSPRARWHGRRRPAGGWKAARSLIQASTHYGGHTGQGGEAKISPWQRCGGKELRRQCLTAVMALRCTTVTGIESYNSGKARRRLGARSNDRKSLEGGTHRRDHTGGTMCRWQGRVKSRRSRRASGRICPWEASMGHHGPIRLLMKGRGARGAV